MTKILITGASGFVGKNLTLELRNRGFNNLFLYDIDTAPELLDTYTAECDFVFHLAGVNRPKDPKEFMTGNFGFTSLLLEKLQAHGNKAPILITSSIQAALSNPYGESKKAGEDLIRSYGEENGVRTYIFRLPNVFGKWCRPNYNSAVATFCHNTARNLPITVNDPSVLLTLVYIDDVVNELIFALTDQVYRDAADFCKVRTEHSIHLGEIVTLLEGFNASRSTLQVPTMSDPFTKKLYSTYLSYLPTDQFAYDLLMHTDNRGSFTEFLKSPDRGQVSINISKPHIVKGNHWHHTKNEKFLVVSGQGVVRFRQPSSEEIITYKVSGDKLQVIDIPTGYTHNIENTGDTDMVTVMWVNEVFDPEHPDTYFLNV